MNTNKKILLMMLVAFTGKQYLKAVGLGDIKSTCKGITDTVTGVCRKAGESIKKQLISTLSQEEKNEMLLNAAKNGHTEKVKKLLDAKAHVTTIDQESNTALHLAAQNGHADIVKILLDAGADVNVTNKNSETALNLAYENDHTEVIEVFQDAKNIRSELRNLGYTSISSN